MKEKTVYQILAILFAIAFTVAITMYANKENECPEQLACPELPDLPDCVCPQTICPEAPDVICPDVEFELVSGRLNCDELVLNPDLEVLNDCYQGEPFAYFKGYLPKNPVVVGQTEQGYEIHEYTKDRVIVYDKHNNPIFEYCD